MKPKRFTSFLLAALSALPAARAALEIRPVSSIELPGAEISAHDPGSDRIFVTSSTGLVIVDLSDPAQPVHLDTIDFTTHGLPATDVTSVAVFGGTVAVAVPDSDKTQPGHVAFLDAADATFIGSVEVGALPDMLTFTPDGSKVLVANEGEIVDTVPDDAMGTVSIIDVSGGFASPPVVHADFTAFDTQAAALKAAGVRIFENGVPSTDFEPEYIAVSPDGNKAMVTLQEANAVALLDIASATFTAVVPLGEKDFSPLFADFSDRDGPGSSTKINLTTGNPVFGLYMPDAIASYEVGGQTYYITANEGDDRDDFITETIRVGSPDYELDSDVFPDAAELKSNARLGRLTVSNSPGLRGDTDGDGKIERILAYGARSFSILNANGAMIYDSGDILETATAALGAPFFDDTRSDNKAAEPEGVVTGVIDGRTYAFIGLERSRSVMAFDVTDPANVTTAGIATYPGDRNPEGITFIAAADAPGGLPMIAVTNESSNTLTLYSIQPATRTADFTLQLLHLADAEAGLLASQTAPNLAALVDAFDGTHPNTLILSGGDNFIPGPFLSAGTDPSLSAVEGIGSTAFARPDIALHNLLGVEASAVGNHEFDLGSNVLLDALRGSGAWSGATFPHITANIDFSGDPLNAIFTPVTLDGAASPLPDAATLAGKIVPTAVIEKGGEKIGLVGVTTQLIETISSPSGAKVLGLPTGGTDDMDLLASQVQPYLDELAAEGVNKIVLLSHLQQLDNERALATKLSGVDIILAAGSNTRLGDPDDVAVAFPGHAATFADGYPIRSFGADGDPTFIVNTDNEFTYLGRLVVDFDADGVIVDPFDVSRNAENGAWAATEENVAAAWGVDVEDLDTTAFAAGTKGAQVKAITDAVQAVIDEKDGTVHGLTTVYLEGERAFVRSQETNLGNITADANAAALREAVGGFEPIVSLKNGGGIRAQIGAVSSSGGSADKLPPLANPAVGKPAGGISQLDIENALRFDNKLMALETTPAGLKAILEHGVAAWPNQGRFPQVGGVSFAWDPERPSGDRITSLALIDHAGLPSLALYKGGEWIGGAPATLHMVTLNFLANNGDGYPMKENGSNFRYLLDDGTLGEALDESVSFTSAAPEDALGEQQAFAGYLAARHATEASAFAAAETPADEDNRIQNASFRDDEVLPFDATQMAHLNTFSASFLAAGQSPSIVTNAGIGSVIDGLRLVGRTDVTGDPGSFGLYTAASIQDLRGTGVLVQAMGGNVRLTLPIERSDDLGGWESAGISLEADLPMNGDKQFYRVTLPDTD